MFKLSYEISKVTFHPYRTARVYERFINIDRCSDEGRKFEEMLAKKAGVTPDNHTAYTLELIQFSKEDPTPHKLYIQCSDFEISIGTRLMLGNF